MIKIVKNIKRTRLLKNGLFFYYPLYEDISYCEAIFHHQVISPADFSADFIGVHLYDERPEVGVIFCYFVNQQQKIYKVTINLKYT